MTALLSALRSPSPATARILPFAVFMAFVVASSLLPAPVPGESAWDTRYVYVARTLLVLLLLAALWRCYGELALRQLRECPVLPAVGMGIAVFAAWIALDQPWASIGEPVGFDPRTADGSMDWMITVPRLVGLVIVVPVMEELFWRSFLQRWIDSPRFLERDPRQSSWRAMLVTSCLFALEHHLLVAGFVAGLGYGWLYARTGNLWAPVIAHAMTNGLLGFWILLTGSWHLW